MAVYKVAQDVEADDKLIGPFSFRQFIYLIVVAMALVLAWGLSQLFVPLAIIPLPIIIFFGALALPLRKDQPMEIYLAAIVSFYLKPRRRLWQPDGVESLVEITAPKIIEIQRTKDISVSEAEQRLSYLADIADTGGWAIRHAAQPSGDNAMISDVYFEAQQALDVLDDSGGVAQSFNNMISQADAARRQQLIDRMHNPAPIATVAAVAADPDAFLYASMPTFTPEPVQATAADQAALQAAHFDPYPSNMHQGMVKPISDQTPPVAQPAPAPVVTPQPATVATPKPQSSTSDNTPSPDIINLANNSDLSIETIAREADRIHKKESDEGEVVISLR